MAQGRQIPKDQKKSINNTQRVMGNKGHGRDVESEMMDIMARHNLMDDVSNSDDDLDKLARMTEEDKVRLNNAKSQAQDVFYKNI